MNTHTLALIDYLFTSIENTQKLIAKIPARHMTESAFRAKLLELEERIELDKKTIEILSTPSITA